MAIEAVVQNNIHPSHIATSSNAKATVRESARRLAGSASEILGDLKFQALVKFPLLFPERQRVVVRVYDTQTRTWVRR